MIRRPCVLLLVGLAGVAAPPLPAQQQITRRDSAGVEIVTVPGAMLDRLPTWRLSAQPTLVIGGAGAEGPYVFDAIGGAVRLPSGHIVVADGLPGGSGGLPVNGVVPEETTGEVRFFSGDGAFLRKAGGIGASLAFSNQVLFLWMHERGVLAWDRVNQRVIVLDTLGGLVERHQWNVNACDISIARGTCFPAGALRSGAIAVINTVPPLSAAPRPGQPPQQLPFLVSTHTTFGIYRGDALTSIDSVPDGVRVALQVGAGRTTLARAFSPTPSMSASPTRIAMGDGSRYEIRIRDESRLVRILRVNRPARPVLPTDIETFRQRGPAYGSLLEIDPPADSLPHFNSLLLDNVNRLWVGDENLGADHARPMTIFDDTGRPVARITLPAGFFTYQIGADFVLGSEADGQVLSPTTGRPVTTRRVVMYKIETGSEQR